MKTPHILLVLALLASATAAGDATLSSPGFPESKVDAQGVVHEPWGTFALHVRLPEGAKVTQHRFDERPVPTAITTVAAGPVTMTQTVYRAPIWPGGVDVVTAHVANTGGEPAKARLELLLPDKTAVGERMCVVGNRPAVALPAGVDAVRQESNPWGCTGGVAAMPGWARPAGDCDPAFGNISAGMGGVPIVYRFTVPPGAERAVALGFCESHWSVPGKRPLEVHVEGAKKTEVDPVKKWGQHVPGCLTFAARDVNQDGRLEVRIAPHPAASDKNTILNVIWIFSPDVHLDPGQLVAGNMTAAAEYYVDVGGKNDQLLYRGGALTYDLELDPGAERELVFLLASPGGGPVPNPDTTAWTPASLRKAAEDVWRDHETAGHK